jgi:CheY-like chemotaxis protein
LNLLCEHSLRMLRRLIGDDIEVRFLPDPGLCNVRADPSGLEQVLMNLCVNARDAMPQGGILTIATGNTDLAVPLPAGEDALPPGRYVQLRVADTGVGIQETIRSQIFEPFFTTKDAGRGTGLGLAVVYGVVRQSGGTVSVQSAPGRGSVFTVYLPQTDEPLREAAEPVAPTPAPGTETLLLVDDNDAVRNVVAQYLRAEGYMVLTADDGPEALDLVGRGPLRIDLLLTDVMMPGLTGVQLAEALTARQPGLRVLYFSGHAPDGLSTDGTLPARTRFLQKPFPLPHLVLEIRDLLDEGP